MRLPRRPAQRDRRPTRLASSQRTPVFAPADITGLEALGLVVSVYGADRLSGRGDKRVSDRALRDAARRLASEARMRDSIRAERLLISLRAAWLHLPAVQRLNDAVARRALWDRIVLFCCEEFYAPVLGDESAMERWAGAMGGPQRGLAPS